MRIASDRSPALCETEAGVVTVFVSGEIDLASASTLEQVLRDADRRAVSEMIVDLAGVTFMDSTGLHLLLELQDRAAHGGYRLRYRDVPAQIQRLFDLAGSIDGYRARIAA